MLFWMKCVNIYKYIKWFHVLCMHIISFSIWGKPFLHFSIHVHIHHSWHDIYCLMYSPIFPTIWDHSVLYKQVRCCGFSFFRDNWDTPSFRIVIYNLQFWLRAVSFISPLGFQPSIPIHNEIHDFSRLHPHLFARVAKRKAVCKIKYFSVT